ncbi:hypothetical protein BOC51_01690 [Burkholderia pseudomallei]|nr:hypothetical protein BOC51_01690 [Burkholderia pseudomallei]
MGFGVWGLRFAVCGLRFAVCGLRFAVCDHRPFPSTFAIAAWHSPLTVWRFVFGVWRFVFGVWRLAQRVLSIRAIIESHAALRTRPHLCGRGG